MIPIHRKILNKKEPVIFFEIVPLPRSTPAAPSLLAIKSIYNSLSFNALNIPEVYDAKSGIKKMEAMKFAELIRNKMGKRAEIIISHPVVYFPWQKQIEKFIKLHNKKILSVILVGGESHKKKYPGPTVLSASQMIKQIFKKGKSKFLFGGIAIPTRKNEAERLFGKTQAGIDFFTSQVIMDEVPVKKMLVKYAKICQENKILPKRIFLSFVPVSRRQNLEFLESLRVIIPKRASNFLLKGWLGVSQRSIELAKKILRDILFFNKKKKLNVPLGLNIEYIMRENFELAYLMGKELIDIYKKYYP